MAPARTAPLHIAVIGAGIAGIACARTLKQAGHSVAVFEKATAVGGRTATHDTPFGAFDVGAQYFTVRVARFQAALATVPGVAKPWSANAVRVLDAFGRVAAASLPTRESHWVATPGMNGLATAWAAPLVADGAIRFDARITRIEPDALDASRWQLRAEGADGAQPVHGGFDAVLLAIPAPPAHDLLRASGVANKLRDALRPVEIAPCWTLMAAFPQASQPTLAYLGPQWNAARSTHHRIAWLAREGSKPRRGGVERWVAQASAEWSAEHLEDDAARVQGKLLRAFSEITGIRAEPAFAAVHRWRFAKTTKPLGDTHLWDAKARIGLAGDWCIGHRVEDAFVSGLSLALDVG